MRIFAKKRLFAGIIEDAKKRGSPSDEGDDLVNSTYLVKILHDFKKLFKKYPFHE
jgi:hypothetical protein